MIIIGLILLIAAVAIGVAGVVNNTGTAHELQDDFTVFGVHVTGSTGTLFLAGLVVGAAGMLPASSSAESLNALLRPPTTAFAVANAITATARDRDDVAARLTLEEAGHRYLSRRAS